MPTLMFPTPHGRREHLIGQLVAAERNLSLLSWIRLAVDVIAYLEHRLYDPEGEIAWMPTKPPPSRRRKRKPQVPLPDPLPSLLPERRQKPRS